jgi:hypothetical protein
MKNGVSVSLNVRYGSLSGCLTSGGVKSAFRVRLRGVAYDFPSYLTLTLTPFFYP